MCVCVRACVATSLPTRDQKRSTRQQKSLGRTLKGGAVCRLGDSVSHNALGGVPLQVYCFECEKGEREGGGGL